MPQILPSNMSLLTSAMSSNPVGVAIVTGGSSGMGLALTNHLIAKGWHVFALDIQPPAIPWHPESGTFLQTDVASWEQLASAFKTAYSAFSRLDFCAFNAGIDDRDDIFQTISDDVEKPPRKPNMLTFDVNLLAPYYGLKLAAHYMSHNPEPVPRGGKVVITSSKAAFLGDNVIPQYQAAKYGSVGLTRAIARTAAAAAAIRVNCLCPGTVATALPPPGLVAMLPEAEVTPMSTILRAFDELADLDGLKPGAGGRAAWVGKGPAGEVVLAEGQHLTPRRVDEVGESVAGRWDQEFIAAWVRAYREQNKKYATQAGA